MIKRKFKGRDYTVDVRPIIAIDYPHLEADIIVGTARTIKDNKTGRTVIYRTYNCTTCTKTEVKEMT